MLKEVFQKADLLSQAHLQAAPIEEIRQVQAQAPEAVEEPDSTVGHAKILLRLHSDFLKYKEERPKAMVFQFDSIVTKREGKKAVFDAGCPAASEICLSDNGSEFAAFCDIEPAAPAGKVRAFFARPMMPDDKADCERSRGITRYLTQKGNRSTGSARVTSGSCSATWILWLGRPRASCRPWPQKIDGGRSDCPDHLTPSNCEPVLDMPQQSFRDCSVK